MTSGSLLALMLCASPALAAGEQSRRPAGSEAQPVTVKVALKAGGQTVMSNGQGSCTHADKGSIYNVLSQMWMVKSRGRAARRS